MRLLLVVGVLGCGNDPKARSLGQVPTVLRVLAEESGANCGGGGLAVQTGRDFNGSGVLDDDEVESTSYTCNGTGGLGGASGCVPGAGARCAGQSLAGQTFRGLDLTDADFTGADLRYADFREATLKNAKLANANLTGARFFAAYGVPANLTGADLNHAQLVAARMDGAVLDGANLSDAVLEGASLNRASAIGTNFDRANLRSTAFEVFASACTMVDADLSRAQLGNGVINQCNLTGANLTLTIWDIDATLTNTNLTRATLNRVMFRNDVFGGNDLTQATFSNVVFYNEGAFFAASGVAGVGALLFGGTTPNWSGRNLSEMHFTGGPALVGVDFSSANFYGTRFNSVTIAGNFANANFERSWTYSSNFSTGSNFSGARFGRSTHLYSNFSGAVAATGESVLAQGSVGAALTPGLTSVFTEASMPADMSGRILDYWQLATAHPSTNFSGASLREGQILSQVNGSNFAGADLSRTTIYGDIAGANFANAKLHNLQGNFPDFAVSDANFSGADLFGASLREFPWDRPAIWENTTCPNGANTVFISGGKCIQSYEYNSNSH